MIMGTQKLKTAALLLPLLLLLPSPSLPAPVADRQLEVGRDLIEAHRSASRTDYEVPEGLSVFVPPDIRYWASTKVNSTIFDNLGLPWYCYTVRQTHCLPLFPVPKNFRTTRRPFLLNRGGGRGSNNAISGSSGDPSSEEEDQESSEEHSRHEQLLELLNPSHFDDGGGEGQTDGAATTYSPAEEEATTTAPVVLRLNGPVEGEGDDSPDFEDEGQEEDDNDNAVEVEEGEEEGDDRSPRTDPYQGTEGGGGGGIDPVVTTGETEEEGENATSSPDSTTNVPTFAATESDGEARESVTVLRLNGPVDETTEENRVGETAEKEAEVGGGEEDSVDEGNGGSGYDEQEGIVDDVGVDSQGEAVGGSDSDGVEGLVQDALEELGGLFEGDDDSSAGTENVSDNAPGTETEPTTAVGANVSREEGGGGEVVTVTTSESIDNLNLLGQGVEGVEEEEKAETSLEDQTDAVAGFVQDALGGFGVDQEVGESAILSTTPSVAEETVETTYQSGVDVPEGESTESPSNFDGSDSLNNQVPATFEQETNAGDFSTLGLSETTETVTTNTEYATTETEMGQNKGSTEYSNEGTVSDTTIAPGQQIVPVEVHETDGNDTDSQDPFDTPETTMVASITLNQETSTTNEPEESHQGEPRSFPSSSGDSSSSKSDTANAIHDNSEAKPAGEFTTTTPIVLPISAVVDNTRVTQEIPFTSTPSTFEASHSVADSAGVGISSGSSLPTVAESSTTQRTSDTESGNPTSDSSIIFPEISTETSATFSEFGTETTSDSTTQAPHAPSETTTQTYASEESVGEGSYSNEDNVDDIVAGFVQDILGGATTSKYEAEEETGSAHEHGSDSSGSGGEEDNPNKVSKSPENRIFDGSILSVGGGYQFGVRPESSVVTEPTSRNTESPSSSTAENEEGFGFTFVYPGLVIGSSSTETTKQTILDAEEGSAVATTEPTISGGGATTFVQVSSDEKQKDKDLTQTSTSNNADDNSPEITISSGDIATPTSQEEFGIYYSDYDGSTQEDGATEIPPLISTDGTFGLPEQGDETTQKTSADEDDSSLLPKFEADTSSTTERSQTTTSYVYEIPTVFFDFGTSSTTEKTEANSASDTMGSNTAGKTEQSVLGSETTTDSTSTDAPSGRENPGFDLSGGVIQIDLEGATKASGPGLESTTNYPTTTENNTAKEMTDSSLLPGNVVIVPGLPEDEDSDSKTGTKTSSNTKSPGKKDLEFVITLPGTLPDVPLSTQAPEAVNADTTTASSYTTSNDIDIDGFILPGISIEITTQGNEADSDPSKIVPSEGVPGPVFSGTEITVLEGQSNSDTTVEGTTENPSNDTSSKDSTLETAPTATNPTFSTNAPGNQIITTTTRPDEDSEEESLFDLDEIDNIFDKLKQDLKEDLFGGGQGSEPKGEDGEGNSGGGEGGGFGDQFLLDELEGDGDGDDNNTRVPKQSDDSQACRSCHLARQLNTTDQELDPNVTQILLPGIGGHWEQYPEGEEEVGGGTSSGGGGGAGGGGGGGGGKGGGATSGEGGGETSSGGGGGGGAGAGGSISGDGSEASSISPTPTFNNGNLIDGEETQITPVGESSTPAPTFPGSTSSSILIEITSEAFVPDIATEIAKVLNDTDMGEDGTNTTTETPPILARAYTVFGEPCKDTCEKRGYGYTWCNKVEESSTGTWSYADYCTTESDVTPYGEKCIDECDSRGYGYYWCHKSSSLWGYCTPDNFVKLSKEWQARMGEVDGGENRILEGDVEQSSEEKKEEENLPAQVHALAYTVYGEPCSDICEIRGVYEEYNYTYTWCNKVSPSTTGTWPDRDHCTPTSDKTSDGRSCLDACHSDQGQSHFWCRTEGNSVGFCTPQHLIDRLDGGSGLLDFLPDGEGLEVDLRGGGATFPEQVALGVGKDREGPGADSAPSAADREEGARALHGGETAVSVLQELDAALEISTEDYFLPTVATSEDDDLITTTEREEHFLPTVLPREGEWPVLAYTAFGEPCRDECSKHGDEELAYTWCTKVESSNVGTWSDVDYCSTGSDVTSHGEKCTDECHDRGYGYYWCHKDTTLWGYCTPEHFIVK